MDNQFLTEILGKDGTSVLKKTIQRAPDLKPVIIPRAVVAWLSTVGKVGYEGELPGLPNTYFSLIKNEENQFSGALTIDGMLHTFEKQDLLHVAASVGVALGIELDEVPDSLKNKDFTKLGKSIDLLVKNEVLKKMKLGSIKMSQHGNFHVEHTGEAKTPYAVKHSFSGKLMLGRIDSLDSAKKIANWFSSKETAKIEAKVAPPQAPQEPNGPVTPEVQRAASTKKVTQKSNLASGQGQKIKVSKAVSEKPCPECGKGQFNKNEFKGCLCLSDLSKYVRTEIVEDNYILNIDSSLDEDEVSTLYSLWA